MKRSKSVHNKTQESKKEIKNSKLRTTKQQVLTKYLQNNVDKKENQKVIFRREKIFKKKK